MKHLLLAAAFAVGSAASALASQIGTANVVFIVDESGSMGGEHAFLEQIIPDLNNALAAEGITTTFGVVGFGDANHVPRTVRTLGDATTTATNLENDLRLDGFLEDGYAGMTYAMNAFNLDADAVNFILVTDEDRDDIGGAYAGITYASMLSALSGSNIVLNAVVNNWLYHSDQTTRVIGVNDEGEAYAADGSGGFTKSAGGIISNIDDGNTKQDYSLLATATGGAVWDLNLLRSGGLLAESFAAAFIDIKVQEIKDQIGGTIPLPAGGVLLLTGIAGFGALRRRKHATA
ncbi:VPLPA-CTERM sorting domain-containing protein [Actibacterium sp. XHP0104]|uniref:VPLPA-CTERM sorting domain-containing protein n=1 Tax=Actibacterium sp. XHP0104 TaxID=2984335 RepID=UPI0021E71F0A|nr:VPLPA-CTERM sorting domain-containing protein [Actibacterium sp. XHP0104]MCV2881854.1 VPLPA-CTERM sorting domain-containing protein [Actibacterium sp. XHP0104]